MGDYKNELNKNEQKDIKISKMQDAIVDLKQAIKLYKQVIEDLENQLKSKNQCIYKYDQVLALRDKKIKGLQEIADLVINKCQQVSQEEYQKQWISNHFGKFHDIKVGDEVQVDYGSIFDQTYALIVANVNDNWFTVGFNNTSNYKLITFNKKDGSIHPALSEMFCRDWKALKIIPKVDQKEQWAIEHPLLFKVFAKSLLHFNKNISDEQVQQKIANVFPILIRLHNYCAQNNIVLNITPTRTGETSEGKLYCTRIYQLDLNSPQGIQHILNSINNIKAIYLHSLYFDNWCYSRVGVVCYIEKGSMNEPINWILTH